MVLWLVTPIRGSLLDAAPGQARVSRERHPSAAGSRNGRPRWCKRHGGIILIERVVQQFAVPRLAIYLFSVSSVALIHLDSSGPRDFLMSRLSIQVNSMSALERHFWVMDKIDKLQFPLPYAQVRE